MLFQDKPLSVLYFEKCLINPPVFPGAMDQTSYLDELHFLSLSGTKSAQQMSERVGEVLGSLAIKSIIAAAIVAVRQQYGNKREVRKLNSVYETLLEKMGYYSGLARTVTQHPYGDKLHMESVAIGMSKGLKFLTFSAQPDVVLEYELEVGPHLVAFRYEIMKNFPPSYLRDKLWEGIKEMTGVTLDIDGHPVK